MKCTSRIIVRTGGSRVIDLGESIRCKRDIFAVARDPQYTTLLFLPSVDDSGITIRERVIEYCEER